MEKMLTIFTPSYNRAYLLPKLYESLKEQTNKDFIWLIVDDGSKDNTQELVEEWKKKSPFEIVYVKKQNGGKHTAIEKSNEVCTTEFIGCVDSDDHLTKNAVEVLLKNLKKIENDKNINGIVSRRATPDLSAFSDKWMKEDKILFFPELYKTYGYDKDTFLVFRTSIIKKYHFPVFEDERFVTESVYYNQFMYDYPMLAIADLIYIGEYMEDGYTAEGIKLFVKSPKGYLVALKQNAWLLINEKASFKEKILYCANYYAWRKLFNLEKVKIKEYTLGFYGLLGYLAKFIIVKRLKKQINNGK